MKRIRIFDSVVILVVLLGGLVLAGCATAPSPAEPEPEPEPIETTAEPAEDPVIAEEPSEQPEETTEDPSQEFEVTEEVYSQTFKDVSDLIAELNEIISSRSYSRWLTYLTEQYRTRYSDPSVLTELSNQPTLKEYDIRLRSLEDYFRYVVVPSRSEVRLDEIIFTDEEHVKALMEVNDRQIILYRLRLIDGKWKIGLAK